MSVAEKADKLLENGDIYSEIHKNIARTLLVMSDSLIVHARNGVIEPQYLSRDMERLESVMKALEDANKVKTPASNEGPEVGVPGLQEALEALGKELKHSADDSASGTVCGVGVADA